MLHPQANVRQGDSTRDGPLSAGSAALPPQATNDEGVRVIRSEELFAGGRLVLIQHADEQYRLLVTRNNRLILQK